MMIKKCTLEDISQLAILNKQLIDDEKSDNRESENSKAKKVDIL